MQLRQWQLKVIENVKRGQHKKTLERLFPGFRPAVEACYFNWEEAYPLPGVTYSATDRKLALCWARALPPRPGASRSGGLEESRERPRPLPAEPAVRPKSRGPNAREWVRGSPHHSGVPAASRLRGEIRHCIRWVQVGAKPKHWVGLAVGARAQWAVGASAG